jgi:hypothetical protein
MWRVTPPLSLLYSVFNGFEFETYLVSKFMLSLAIMVVRNSVQGIFIFCYSYSRTTDFPKG